MTQHKYKVGDKVKVMANTNSHNFGIGQEVTLISCEQFQGLNAYDAKSLHGCTWYVRESDIELIKENKTMQQKQFKNSFGVKSDSTSLLEAFVKEVEILGWKDQGHGAKGEKSLFFKGTGKVSGLENNHYWYSSIGSEELYYNLPEQWNEAIKAASEIIEVKEEFEKGDYVTVDKKPSMWTGSAGGDCPLYDGPTFPYTGIILNTKVWGREEDKQIGYNIEGYGFCLSCTDIRKATEEEIEKSQTIDIKGYTATKEGSLIAFGCQKFDKADLRAYRDLLNRPISINLEIEGTKITKEILEKLISKLD